MKPTTVPTLGALAAIVACAVSFAPTVAHASQDLGILSTVYSATGVSDADAAPDDQSVGTQSTVYSATSVDSEQSTTPQSTVHSAADTADQEATVGAASTVYSAAEVDSESRVVLPIRVQRQEAQNWCWAATGLSVTQFHGQGVGATQNDFCRAGFGFTGARCPDEPGHLRHVQAGFRHFGVSPGYTGGSMTMREVKSEIDAGRPIPVGYFWKAGGGHMVTVIGYNTDTGDILINDSYPTHPRQSWVNIHRFTNNSEYYWSASIPGVGAGVGIQSTVYSRMANPEPVVQPASTVYSALSISADSAMTASEANSVAQGFGSRSIRARIAAHLSSTGAPVHEDNLEVSEPVRLLSLNPAFVAGTSEVPTILAGYVAKVSVAGITASVTLSRSEDGSLVFGTLSLDPTTATMAASGEGTFVEPQTGAWYRLTDGRITALNDAAKAGMSDDASLAGYRKTVQTRYGDKLAGSTYQHAGYYGGFGLN